MYIYIYIYMYIHKYTQIYIYIHIYIYTYMQTCDCPIILFSSYPFLHRDAHACEATYSFFFFLLRLVTRRDFILRYEFPVA